MGALDDVYLELALPEAKSFQVTGFGENAVDWVCTVPTYPGHDSKMQMDSILRLGGGTIATACALCARYGLRTRYVGRVGDDETGKFSRSDLAKESMDLVLDVVTGASSHFSLIIVDRATGKRTILWNRDPRLCYGEGELCLERLLETQLLLLDGIDPAASVVLARAAKAASVRTILDMDRVQRESEELLSLVDIAIPSVSFVREFAGVSDWREGLEKIAEICPGLVGVTLGEEGAAVIWNKEISRVPSFAVEVVDSTAAGDVFHGAFLFAILKGWSLGRCMRFSNAAGALSCQRLGARASIPPLEDVLDMEKGEIQ